MADRTINVSLDFTANTSSVENALKNLQTSLANIGNLQSLKTGETLSKDMIKASDAANVLRVSLQSALDVNTGKLNLTKFQTTLKSANTDIRTLGKDLSAIGPEGQAAFRDLTNAILSSDTPLRQTNALVGKLWDSLKRTAGWQLSSTMIHGFMGAIQSAYGYAQDLNRSLNNIRIVTGASTDDMAKFAEQANKSAKALSTTTTNYTDAALIYYQQGIRDQNEIAERVAVTTKLANVSRQSAEEVSSQMTAIWNNFDDGSHSLEYYADVITALGAATASSSQEISRGLQQFAATAQTVGLSYEYATSALATIVATTRQSADTVGTGLRTLFARLEGLKLGETLEDGVDLNKYSKALEAVGVQVLDASGNLKNMDTILDDLAGKWNNLGRQQKMALAQTVGGVRQYNNLIALMDNWDSMQQNLQTATGSTGALQEQQDRYAEGWEAAQKRVQSAAEGLFQSLLDDKFFIKLTNGFANIIESVDKFIDTIGGLKTVLPGLGVILNRVFGNQIKESIAQISFNVAGLIPQVTKARQAADTKLKNETIAAYKQVNLAGVDTTSAEGQALEAGYSRIAELQTQMTVNADKMTESQKRLKQLEIDRLEVLTQENVKIGQQIDEQRKLTAEKIKSAVETANYSKNTKRIAGFSDKSKTWNTDGNTDLTVQQKIDEMEQTSPRIAASLRAAAEEMQVAYGGSLDVLSLKLEEFHQKLRNACHIDDSNYNEKLTEMEQDFRRVSESIGFVKKNIDRITKDDKGNTITIDLKTKDGQAKINALKKELEKLKSSTKNVDLSQGIQGLIEKLEKGEIELQDVEKELNKLRQQAREKIEVEIDVDDEEIKQKLEQERQEQLNSGATEAEETGAKREGMENQPEVPEMPTPNINGYEQFANTLQNIANVAMTAQTAVQAFGNIVDIINDKSLSGGEKAEKIITTLLGVLPSLAVGVLSMGQAVQAAGAAAGTGVKIFGISLQTAFPWLLAITAAVTILIGLFNKFHKSEEDIQTEKTEALKKSTEDAANATEKATQKVTELKNAYDDFTSSADKLANMTEGTNEYNEALTVAKEKLEELIKLYKLTPEDWTFNPKTNSFELTESGQKKVDKGIEEASQQEQAAETTEAIVKYEWDMWQAGGNIGNRKNYIASNRDAIDLMTAFHDQANSEYIKDDGTSGTAYRLGLVQQALRDYADANDLSYSEVNNLETLKQLRENGTLDERTQESVDAIFAQQEARGWTDDELNTKIANAFSLYNIGSYNNKDSWLYQQAQLLDSQDSGAMKEASTALMNNLILNNDELNGLKTSLLQQGFDFDSLVGDMAPHIEEAISDRLEAYIDDGKISNENRQRAAKLMGFDYHVDKNGNTVVTDENGETVDDVRMGRWLAANDLATNPEYIMNYMTEQMSTALNQQIAEKTEGALQNADLSDQDKKTFQDYAADVDWTDDTEVALFRENMKALTDATPEVIEEFINALRAGAKKISDSTLDDDIDQKQEAYDNAAQNLSLLQNYENAKRTGEGVEEAQAELQSFLRENGGTMDIQAATQAYIDAKNELQTAVDEQVNADATKYGLNAEELSELTDIFWDANTALAEGEGMLENTAEAAEDAARRYARLNKGIEDLAANSKDYLSIIQSLNKDSSKANKTHVQTDKNYKALQKTVANLLDVTEDLVDVDFLATLNPKDLENAAKGDQKAIQNICNSFIDYQAQLAGLANDPNIDAFKAKIANLSEGQVIDIDADPFLQSLIQAKLAAGATETEIEAMLSGFRIDLDGIEKFEADVTGAQYKAYLAGEGIKESLGFDVDPEDDVIVNTSSKEITGSTITTTQVPIHFSLPSVSPSEGGGYEIGEPATATGYAEQFNVQKSDPEQIKDDEKIHVTALKIKNAHGSSGGDISPSHSGGSGGGGGGGGGGGSKKTKEAPKADRGARYHNVTRRASNTSRRQTENNRRKDRAFGKAQIDLQKEDIKLQKEKADLQREYIEEISKNLKEDREEMQKQFGPEGLNLPVRFTFDSDGEITNYQDVMDALLEKEKALVEQYNAGGLDDEAFEEAKKKLDEAKEALGNYEETLELQKDEIQTLEEYMEELSDKALELTQIKFELNMSIVEDQLEWLDYSLTKLEDDAYGAAKAIALIGEQTQQYVKQSEIAQNTIGEILARHGVSSLDSLNGLTDTDIEKLGFSKNEIDALKEYRSNLYDANNALLEIRRTITDKVLETFDTFNEKIERSYDQFEHYSNILENFNDIADLLGTKVDEKTRELLKTIQNTQLRNLRNQASSAKSIYEGALKDYDLAKQNYEQAKKFYNDPEGRTVQVQQMEEIMNQMADKRDEAYENWLDAYTESLEKAREIYEAEMEQLERDFEQSLIGIYGTFDLFDAAYERTKDLRENYIPEYEKIYELNKLNRDIQKEIDNSSSLRDRKALRQLQEEINRKQEAGVQLSKYEVDEMRKKFELEQARMNLEDARNSKSEVRLTRDQNGNWGYVYTASEDKVADAEQRYEDALYQYQKLSDDYVNDLDEKIKELGINTKEQIKEIWDAFNEGLINEDQRDQQVSQVMEGYQTQRDYLLQQFGAVTENLSSSLGLMKELFGQEGNLIDSFGETLIGQLSGDGSLEEFFTNTENGLNTYITKVAEASATLKKTNEDLANENALNLQQIGEETEKLGILSDTTKEKTQEMVQVLSTNLNTVMTELETWDQQYGKTIQKAIDENEAFIRSLDNMFKRLSLISSFEMKDVYDSLDKVEWKGSHGEDITQADWQNVDNTINPYKEKASIEKFDFDTWNKPIDSELDKNQLENKQDILSTYRDAVLMSLDAYKKSLKESQNMSTELAIIEQSAIKAIDALAKTMNSNNLDANALTTLVNNMPTQTVTQDVHIEASFPNATEHNEIEMAFDNLVNKASQYINRKNMSSMTFQDSYLSPV